MEGTGHRKCHAAGAQSFGDGGGVDHDELPSGEVEGAVADIEELDPSVGGGVQPAPGVALKGMPSPPAERRPFGLATLMSSPQGRL